MGYPGGKEGAGVYQTIINQIPPHQTYIEGFAGGAAILRYKRPAQYSIAIDADAAVVEQLSTLEMAGLRVIHGSALEFLRDYPWTGREFVYLDPPYLRSVRSSGRAIYNCEMMDDTEHLELLTLIKAVPADVMISGYWSELYGQHLADWRTVAFQTMTRGGRLATEWLWCNYPQPIELHDYRYLGADYREREKFAKRYRRLRAKLTNMPVMERRALLAAVDDFRSTASTEMAVRSSSSKASRVANIAAICGIVEDGEGTR